MAIYNQYADYVKAASNKYGVSENLIWAVIEQESGGNRTALSSVGAGGLMQLMPDTARELGVSNVFDAEQNINGGTKLLAQFLDRWDGDTEAALASYFAGANNVKKYGKEKYSWYYQGVLSKMETVPDANADASIENTGSWIDKLPLAPGGLFGWLAGPTWGDVKDDVTGGMKDTGLVWWGNILLTVILTVCVLLGVVFVYFSIEGIPDANDVIKLVK